MKVKFIGSILLLIFISSFCKGTAYAQDGHFQLAITPRDDCGIPDLQLLDKDSDVYGLRIDLFAGLIRTFMG